MKISTSELAGPALDWAVAKCGERCHVANKLGDEIDVPEELT